MTYLPPHPSPLPQGARERTRVAFTLAEVLITLGIIGVVAAMTIPNLITAHQKKVTVTKLQKAISVLNQAYRSSNEENGIPTSEEISTMGAKTYFDHYWVPYLKAAHICQTYSECGYKSSKPLINPDGTSKGTTIVSNERITFYTADGFLYIIFITGGGGAYTLNEIDVDINGGNGPNRYGKDVFVLQRYDDEIKGGTIMPDYYNKSDDIVNNSCSKTGNGYACAERIRRAGWQIEKNYPW